MSEDINKIRSQMRKGFLEFCVLCVIEKGRIYSSDLLAKLTEADLVVVEGTIYPLLSRLTKEGYLNYVWIESTEGPPRKYYELSPNGAELLVSYKQSWNELSTSINFILNRS